MNSKEKCDIAKAESIRFYTKKQWEVSLPIGDKKPYDIIVDNNEKLLKVQCKYSTQKLRKRNGEYLDDSDVRRTINLRVMGGNQSYNTAKKYKKGDFDLLFSYTDSDLMHEIPFDNIEGKSSIVVGGSSYKEFKLN